MRFSIITPTYKRADKLIRAVRSAQNQTYQDWEMIIVNDSPNDESYHEFASSINDPRIHYHLNKTNSGVNFTRNHALDRISADSKWVIFLDDDDYLAPDALKTFHDLILAHPDQNWFITNRAYANGTPVTAIEESDRAYSYIWDYLIIKRVRGDATHAISTDKIHTIRFSKKIKQGEEWIFFYELGLTEKMFYHDHNSTITDGYGELNHRKQTSTERLKSLLILFYEGLNRKIAYRPTFLIYVSLRFVRAFLNN